jgi:hypothetical protein
MRLAAASSAACEKLWKLRVIPTAALVSEKSRRSVPKKSRSATAPPPLISACAPG